MFGTDFLLLQLLFLCYFGEAVLNTILKNKFTREALEERIYFFTWASGQGSLYNSYS
jgi:hypothetical protein